MALKGKKTSEETKKKQSDTHKRIGTKPPTWASLSANQKEIANKKRMEKLSLRGGHPPNWKGSGMWNLSHREKLAGRKRPDQCEVCGVFGSELKRGLYFDHDHETGLFRGWLCARCNSCLGFVKDNAELLIKLAEYLKKSKGIGISR